MSCIYLHTIFIVTTISTGAGLILAWTYDGMAYCWKAAFGDENNHVIIFKLGMGA